MTMVEREVKLLLEPDTKLPDPQSWSKRARVASDAQIDQDSTYYDTPDLRLTRSGASLRYRTDDGWTVKLPELVSAHRLVRAEHVFPGDPGQPPVQCVELVTSLIRAERLVAVARLGTRRRKIRLTDAKGGPLAEVVDDRVTPRPPAPAARAFREVEIEIDDEADPREVRRLVKRLGRHARNAAALPKVARALGRAARAPADVPKPSRLPKRATTGRWVETTLARSVARLLAADPVVRIGEDSEGVHQARVATRRLRSDLRTFRPVLDAPWSEQLRRELRWAGELLGRVRDADVLRGLLEERIGRLEPRHRDVGTALLRRLERERQRDRDELLDAMRSPRYLALLDALVDAARAPRLRPHPRRRRARRAARHLTRRPWRRLRREVRSLPSRPPDAALHEVRKRAKQARYAYEAAAPLAGSGARRVAKRLADLQGVLGEHQDAVVATAWLEAAARQEGRGEVAFVAGLVAAGLAAEHRHDRRAWRSAWGRARRAHRDV
jgi:CHAD domain-containing protein